MEYLLTLCSGMMIVLNILDSYVMLRVNKTKEIPISVIIDSKKTYKLLCILSLLIGITYTVFKYGDIEYTATTYTLYMMVINLIISLCLHTFNKNYISARFFRLNGYVFPLEHLKVVRTERLKNGKIKIIGVAPLEIFKKQHQLKVSFYMAENVALNHLLLKSKLIL